ncbi:MAG: DNA recombination protein RmuC [Leptospiraceae bacterium]|nr:DNA recombination protein RmuC [Leptospiraceae bacterium]
MELLTLLIGLALGILVGLLIGWARALKSGSDTRARLAARDIEVAQLQKRLEDQVSIQQSAEEKFGAAFKSLSQDILVNQGRQLLQQNQSNMDAVLGPLKERIKEFQDKVERSHKEAGEQAVSLSERLRSLENLGLQMSQEADRLTRALKGDTKKQGNWGEFILERILEDSGLRKGKEYLTQGSDIKVEEEGGKRIRPDVVVRLPEEKHLVIDSKVSLVSYEAFASAEEDTMRKQHAKELIRSIRNHVDGLNTRHYQGSKGLNSPDFVLMFMPIEASFSVAVAEDSSLFQYAWDKRIMIVTPTTLMATLWIISSIWRQENQTHFALEIAKESGRLYDKFVGFAETFQDVGKTIDKSKEQYDRALDRLQRGRGNLIQRAEKIRKMGAVASKRLSRDQIHSADAAEDGDAESELLD